MVKRILIAEQDDGVREALAARLRKGGAVVYDASDADSASEVLSAAEIDVAVIGMAGFGSEGLHLLKLCRSFEPPTEVILIVDKDQGSLAITGMKLGAFRDVQAPVHVESLQEIIGQAYDVRRKERRRSKRRVVSGLPKLFAAITFAEHGEFETAEQIREKGSATTDKDVRKRGYHHREGDE
jgi:DNA-binding NtrC family response regulator